MNLRFVSEEPVRVVLEEYLRQAEAAHKADAFLGAIVGYGSVIEGLLTWALLQSETEAMLKAPKDKQGNARPLKEWFLPDLIKVSHKMDLIGQAANQASWALKDFRNFIHPYNVLKQSARPDMALAMAAKAAMIEITRSLEGRMLK